MFSLLFTGLVKAAPSQQSGEQDTLGGENEDDSGAWLVLAALLLLGWSWRRRRHRKRLENELEALDRDLRKLSGYAPVQGFQEAYLEPGLKALEHGGTGERKRTFKLIREGRRQCHVMLGEHMKLRDIMARAEQTLAQCRREGLQVDPEPLHKLRDSLHRERSLPRLQEQAQALLASYQRYLGEGREARETLRRLHHQLSEADPFVAVDQARNGLDQAQVALNRGEAARAHSLAKAAIHQLRQDIQTAQPELLAQIERELPLGVWHTLRFRVSNHGRAHARDVRLRLEGVKYRPIASLTSLRAGETKMLEVSLKMDRQGTLPLNLIMTGARVFDNGLISFEQAEWLEVGRPGGPVQEHHPGWRPSRNAVSVIDPQLVDLLRETEFYRGYVRVKVAAHNRTDRVVTDAAIELLFDEMAFRLDRVEPDFTMVGTKAMLGNINPGQKRALAYYLDPLICTTSQLDGALAFKDIQGVLHLNKMRPHQVEVKCPLFFTPEEANTATLTKLVTQELEHSDARVFGLVPGLSPQETFTMAKEVLGGRDIRHVQTLDREDPYTAEAWYFGQTKVQQHRFAIRIVVDETTRSLELFCAAPAQEALTGLLAELGSDIKERLQKAGWPIQRITNITIRDSILNRTALLFQPPEGPELDDEMEATVSNLIVKDSVLHRAKTSVLSDELIEPDTDQSPSPSANDIFDSTPTPESEPWDGSEENEDPSRQRSRAPNALELELARLREIEQQLP